MQSQAKLTTSQLLLHSFETSCEKWSNQQIHTLLLKLKFSEMKGLPSKSYLRNLVLEIGKQRLAPIPGTSEIRPMNQERLPEDHQS